MRSISDEVEPNKIVKQAIQQKYEIMIESFTKQMKEKWGVQVDYVMMYEEEDQLPGPNPEYQKEGRDQEDAAKDNN